MTNPETLKERLRIDKSQLDREVSEQPMLFFDVAEAYEEAVAERDGLKEALATIDAELDGAVRVKLEKRHDKYTEAMVKNGVQLDPKHEKAFQAYIDAKTRAGKLESMKEAFKQRNYMVRELASLFVASYFEQSSIQGTNSTDRAVYEEQRQRLARARKSR